MFRLNFSKLFSDFSLRKEKTDMFIHTWKNQHKNVYADFKSGIDKVADGDLTLLYNMYALMKDCVPPEAQSFYDWFGGLLTQSPTRTSTLMSDTQWAGKYTEKIARCEQYSETYNIQGSSSVSVLDGSKLYLKALMNDELKNIDSCEVVHGSFGFTGKMDSTHIALLSISDNVPPLLVIEKGDTLAFCMYYFVVFNHGLPRMMQLLNGILTKEDVDENGLVLIRNSVHSLVYQSMELGAETKASWENAVEDCNPEIWKDVLFLLHKTKGKRGKKKSIRTLDEILIGDIAAQKKKIRLFLDENEDDICLAYLLLALVQTGKVKDAIPYMTFHRAMEHFTGRHIGHDIPQKRYGELKNDSGYLSPYSNSCKRAKRIIYKWTRVFAETD